MIIFHYDNVFRNMRIINITLDIKITIDIYLYSLITLSNDFIILCGHNKHNQ